MKSVLLFVLVLAGCVPFDHDHDGVRRIACLGDSNTASLSPRSVYDPFAKRWCEYARDACPTIQGQSTAWYNYGLGGAVVDPAQPYAAFELGEALTVHADGVVVLLGTNDVGLLGAQPSDVAADLDTLCSAALAHNLSCTVITLPPSDFFDVIPYNQAMVARAVARVGTTIANLMLVDGTTGFAVFDGTHLDDASQRVLGARVAVKLGCDG